MHSGPAQDPPVDSTEPNDPTPTRHTLVEPSTPPPVPEVLLTNEQVLDHVEAQLNSLEMATTDSEHAKQWLKDTRLPLLSLSVNSLVALVHSRVHGTTDAHLRSLLRNLTPDELNAALGANAGELDRIANERVREAALVNTAKARLSSVAANYIINAMMHVAGLPPLLVALGTPTTT